MTLDRVYIITALAGLMIDIFGYLGKRRTEKLKRIELEQNIRSEQARFELDRVCAQAMLDYLNGSKDSPAMQKSPEVIQRALTNCSTPLRNNHGTIPSA